jgi:hypothetical protein
MAVNNSAMAKRKTHIASSKSVFSWFQEYIRKHVINMQKPSAERLQSRIDFKEKEVE